MTAPQAQLTDEQRAELDGMLNHVQGAALEEFPYTRHKEQAAERRQIIAYVESLMRQGWLPVQSAPMDGTVVLVGRFMGEPWGFVYGAGYYFSKNGAEGWICRGLRDPPGELGLGNPTHWQPIPPPPASERGEHAAGQPKGVES